MIMDFAISSISIVNGYREKGGTAAADIMLCIVARTNLHFNSFDIVPDFAAADISGSTYTVYSGCFTFTLFEGFGVETSTISLSQHKELSDWSFVESTDEHAEGLETELVLPSVCQKTWIFYKTHTLVQNSHFKTAVCFNQNITI
jgi:hypothetical protein